MQRLLILIAYLFSLSLVSFSVKEVYPDFIRQSLSLRLPLLSILLLFLLFAWRLLGKAWEKRWPIGLEFLSACYAILVSWLVCVHAASMQLPVFFGLLAALWALGLAYAFHQGWLEEMLFFSVFLINSPLFVPSLGTFFDHVFLEWLCFQTLLMVLAKRSHQLKRVWRSLGVLAPLALLLVLWLVLTTALSVSVERSVVAMVRYWSLFCVMFAAYLHFFGRELPQVCRAWLGILTAVSVFLVLGWICYALQPGSGLHFGQRHWFLKVNPTHMAQFVLGLLVVGLMALRKGRAVLGDSQQGGLKLTTKIWVVFLWVQIALLSVILWLTYSRAALLGLFVIVLALAGARFRALLKSESAGFFKQQMGKQRMVALLRANKLAVLVFGALLILLFLDGSWRSRVFQHSPVQYLHESGRLVDWQNSLSVIAQRPWTGHGLDTHRLTYPLYQRDPNGAQMPPAFFHHAHNGLLGIAEQVGWIGLALLFVVCLALALHWRRSRQITAANALPNGVLDNMPLVTACWLALVSLFVSLQFGVLLYDTTFLIAWLTLGLVVVSSLAIEPPSESYVRTNARARVAGNFALVLILVVTFYVSWQSVFRRELHQITGRGSLAQEGKLARLEQLDQRMGYLSQIAHARAVALIRTSRSSDSGKLLQADPKERFRQAADHLKEAIRRSPLEVVYYDKLAVILERELQDYEEAREVWLRRLALSPHHRFEAALSGLVSINLELGDLDEAKHYFKQLVRDAPALAHSLMVRTSYRRQLSPGRPDHLGKVLERALDEILWAHHHPLWTTASEIGAEHWTVLDLESVFGVAYIFERLGWRHRARRLFLRLHALFPQDMRAILTLIRLRSLNKEFQTTLDWVVELQEDPHLEHQKALLLLEESMLWAELNEWGKAKQKAQMAAEAWFARGHVPVVPYLLAHHLLDLDAYQNLDRDSSNQEPVASWRPEEFLRKLRQNKALGNAMRDRPQDAAWLQLQLFQRRMDD